jgi:hypothetical protein
MVQVKDIQVDFTFVFFFVVLVNLELAIIGCVACRVYDDDDDDDDVDLVATTRCGAGDFIDVDDVHVDLLGDKKAATIGTTQLSLTAALMDGRNVKIMITAKTTTSCSGCCNDIITIIIVVVVTDQGTLMRSKLGFQILVFLGLLSNRVEGFKGELEITKYEVLQVLQYFKYFSTSKYFKRSVLQYLLTTDLLNIRNQSNLARER